MLRNNEEGVPFRISDNIKEFISDVGMKGLLPNTITSCSLALRNIKPYLRSVFFLEENMQNNKISNENINALVADTVERIDILTQPYLNKKFRSQLR